MSVGQNDNAILKLLADEQLRKENAALAADNERLRRAGDAMHRAIKVSDYALDWAIEVWLAAKEGRDVK